MNDLRQEVLDFIEFLSKQKDSTGQPMLDNLTPNLLYKQYFEFAGKSYFAFEKGLYKVLLAYNIYRKTGQVYKFSETHFKEFKKDSEKKQAKAQTGEK